MLPKHKLLVSLFTWVWSSSFVVVRCCYRSSCKLSLRVRSRTQTLAVRGCMVLMSVNALLRLDGTAPAYRAESLLRTSNVDTRRRLRSADSAMLVVPSTRRSTLGDRAFPVASFRHVRGTACRRLSGTVADDVPSRAEEYFSGRRLTMIRRS